MINVHIRGNGIELTESVSEYVNKKASALEKYFSKDESVDLSVEVGKTTEHHKQGEVFRAEFDMRASGKQFRSAVEEEDLYAAIDKAKDEIISEIRTYKGKKDTLFRKGARKMKDIIHGFYKR